VVVNGLKIWHIDPLTKAEAVSFDNQGEGKASAVSAAQGKIVLQYPGKRRRDARTLSLPELR
jgi:hypothetical protein